MGATNTSVRLWLRSAGDGSWLSRKFAIVPTRSERVAPNFAATSQYSRPANAGRRARPAPTEIAARLAIWAPT